MNKKIDAQRLKDLGQEFENAHGDINKIRTKLQGDVEAMPYQSETAAGTFRAAMENWDMEFDSICNQLVAMRDKLGANATRATDTENNNRDHADFFKKAHPLPR